MGLKSLNEYLLNLGEKGQLGRGNWGRRPREAGLEVEQVERLSRSQGRNKKQGDRSGGTGNHHSPPLPASGPTPCCTGPQGTVLCPAGGRNV